MTLCQCHLYACHCTTPPCRFRPLASNIMTIDPQSLGVFIRFQEPSTEYVDVAIASAKEPASVRSALLKALRHVALRSIDVTLLRIEHELLAVFKSPWKKPNKLQSVLESCRQGKCTKPTERLFHEYAGDSGIVILGVATRRDAGLRTKYDGRWLLREIDALSDEEKIDLATSIHGNTEPSVTTDVVAILQSFARSPLGTHQIKSIRVSDVTRGLHPTCALSAAAKAEDKCVEAIP